MVHDAAIPAGIEPVYTAAERQGIYYSAAMWTPDLLELLALDLQISGRDSLAQIPGRALLDAWCETLAVFRDPGSAERQTLDPVLPRLCQLSPAGLEAGLESVLGGVDRDSASKLQRQADGWTSENSRSPLVILSLAANLPALAVQPLLPALLLRCPVILKSPSSEPLFAPAFVNALTERLPALKPALAAITWKGGDISLEAPLFSVADRILAYGDAETVADLESRAPERVFAYGPKTSLALMSDQAEPTIVAAGLARDIALFDQRGCLSIQAVFTTDDPNPLARGIAVELDRLAERWPPGPIDPVAAAGVQQVRMEAALRGLTVADTPLRTGTVVIEPEARFQPGPGLRTVRIHPLASMEQLPEILMDWSGQLQGAALAGDSAWQLCPRLTELGISHFAAPGELQTPDATWHNGGVHPFTALTGDELRDD